MVHLIRGCTIIIHEKYLEKTHVLVKRSLFSESRFIQRQRKEGTSQGHYRTWSYPTHNSRRLNSEFVFSDSFCSLGDGDSSARANKRLCRSLSVPGQEFAQYQVWTPRASAVWQPIKTFEQNLRKVRSVSYPEEPRVSGTASGENDRDSTCVTESGMNAISTPPDSPTPRPASANAALNDHFIFARIEEESEDCCVSRSGRKRYFNRTKESSSFLPSLPRSHSQPCFATDSFQAKFSAGVKRKSEGEHDKNRLRPALDLAKMEEVIFFGLWLTSK